MPRESYRRGERDERVYRLLEQAAKDGRPSPTNNEIADALGLMSSGGASAIITRLAQRGRIAVQRGNCNRVVTIVATGKSTAGRIAKPHWRASKVIGPAVADDCSGAQLVALIRDHAVAHNLDVAALIQPLTATPAKWLKQVAAAARPKPDTTAKVRALLAGKPLPPELLKGGAGRAARNGLTADQEVLRRIDAGQDTSTIRQQTGLHPSVIAKAAAMSSEANTIAMKTDLRAGSAQLLEAIAAEAADREKRFAEARRLAISNPIPIGRPTPTLARPAMDYDRRPIAADRGPCPRCATRGDLGCAHQRPYEAPQVAA